MLKATPRVDATAGFTLVELMTAMAIGLALLSAVIWTFVEVSGATQRLIRRAQLNQTLVSALSVMTAELRRAGYWSEAAKTLGGAMVNGYAPVRLSGSSCILYSYDREKNNTDGIPGAEDQHGLRLSNGALQIKTSDAACGAATCGGCDSGNWSALTDPQTLTIEQLSFERTDYEQPFDAGRHLARVREIRITLGAAPRGDPSLVQTMSSTVNVRNDEVL